MNFFERVYEIVKNIPEGKVATYGDIAKMLGNQRASRAVGWALHNNPYQGIVPCHRVVNNKGELSKSFVFGGANIQKRLLQEEGVYFDDNDKVDLKVYRMIAEIR
ncbi:MAG TPA: cysteine methyltransferase [Clostridiales bacterium]|nr:MAG: cysteine methyltransferase [Clostridiales bacterium GWD2_32_59]HAN10478.1 cysteine methyltransferase [Clostridiales bacterium]